MKVGLPLMKNVLTPLTESVLVQLGYTVAILSADRAIPRKIFGLWMTKLIISIEEMQIIMKVVKYLEESGLLIRGVTKTTENEKKEQKSGFLDMLLQTLAASSLGNMLTGKGVIWAGKETIRVGQDF